MIQIRFKDYMDLFHKQQISSTSRDNAKILHEIFKKVLEDISRR